MRENCSVNSLDPVFSNVFRLDWDIAPVRCYAKRKQNVVIEAKSMSSLFEDRHRFEASIKTVTQEHGRYFVPPRVSNYQRIPMQRHPCVAYISGYLTWLAHSRTRPARSRFIVGKGARFSKFKASFGLVSDHWNCGWKHAIYKEWAAWYYVVHFELGKYLWLIPRPHTCTSGNTSSSSPSTGLGWSASSLEIPALLLCSTRSFRVVTRLLFFLADVGRSNGGLFDGEDETDIILRYSSPSNSSIQLSSRSREK